MSILDSIRRLFRRSPKGGEQATTDASMRALIERFYASKDEEQKAALWKQLCAALPKSLFLCAFCYDGDNPNAKVSDRTLHATKGSKPLYAANSAAINSGNPGYSLAKTLDSRRMFLRKIIYNPSKEEWVPLFTDFHALMPVFGKNFRIAVISFDEARKIAEQSCGIVINPGKNAIKLPADILNRAK